MAKAVNKKSAPKKAAPKKTTGGNNGKVKAKSTAADGLRELFIDELKDIYWGGESTDQSFA